MATINLNQKWRLSSDRYQWILEERFIRERQADGQDQKTGETWKKGDKYETWEDALYCRTLEQVLEAALQHRPRASDADTIQDLAAEVRACIKDIRAVSDALKAAVRP